MNQTEKLLNMKQTIDKAKEDVSRLEGRKEQLYETLKNDHGCETIKEAEKKLDKMNKELDKKETSLQQGVSELEANYDWE